jgi:hypothetical protein
MRVVQRDAFQSAVENEPALLIGCDHHCPKQYVEPVANDCVPVSVTNGVFGVVSRKYLLNDEYAPVQSGLMADEIVVCGVEPK